MKNIKPCPCCQQDRPIPTEPGIWEYNSLTGCPDTWLEVETKWVTNDPRAEEPYLGVFQDGEQIWWPDRAMWRQIK